MADTAVPSPGRAESRPIADQVGGDARPRVCVGNTWFDNVTMTEAVERIDALVRARRPALVVTPNVDHLVRLQQDREYAALVTRADLVLPDGQPIVWAARLLGTPLKARVAGSDLLPVLCAHAAVRGYRVFFLGGDPGVAEEARAILTQRHAGLRVVGTHCPAMGFELGTAEDRRALEAVRAGAPQIVLVGLGSPKQERWIQLHMHEYGPAVSIGVGISLSFVTGRVQRAPRWMQRTGLEWLHRVGMEPRRLARRYLVRGWGFVPVVLRDVAQRWASRQAMAARPEDTR